MKEDIKENENIQESKDFILENIREQARQVAENLLAIYSFFFYFTSLFIVPTLQYN